MKKMIYSILGLFGIYTLESLQAQSQAALSAFTDAQKGLETANQRLVKKATAEVKHANKVQVELQKKIAKIEQTIKAAEQQHDQNTKLAQKIDKLLND